MEALILDNFIPLLAALLSPAFLRLWFYPFFCLAFIATVPCIIRTFTRR